MKAKFLGQCRGDGYGYIEFSVPLGQEDVAVRATCGSEPVPSYLVREQPGASAYVAVVPLLEKAMRVVVFVGNEPVGYFVYDPLASKVESRLRYMRKGSQVSRIRDIEKFDGTIPTATIDGMYPSGGSRIVWMTFEGLEPPHDLKIYDGAMREMYCDVRELECNEAVDEYGLSRTVMHVSITMPANVPSFLVRASGAGAYRFVTRADVAYFEDSWRRKSLNPEADPGYDRWFRMHRISDVQVEKLRADIHSWWSVGIVPTCNLVLVDAFEKDAVQKTIASADFEGLDIRKSLIGPGIGTESKGIDSYATLREACAVPSDYIAVVKAGHTLEPGALALMVRALEQDLGACLAVCDADVYDGTYRNAELRNRFCHEDLLGGNGAGDFCVVKKSLLVTTDVSDVYDLVLKAYESSPQVCQLHKVLVHKRPGVEAKDAPDVLGAHLKRSGIDGEVVRNSFGDLSVHYHVDPSLHKVSVVIPSHEHPEYLKACIGSILEQTTYPNYEIIVVENNSTDEDLFAYYDELHADHRDRVRVVTFEKPFNYSSVVNYGASFASGDLYVFLNNDTKVLTPDWLQLLVGPLTRTDVGVTGAKLLFADGLVQHAGVIAVPDGGFGHVNQFMTLSDRGYLGTLSKNVGYSMVTGACQATRADVWKKLDGYNERLAVGFNDGDYCMRARDLGLDVVLVNECVLEHREFGTRSRESEDVREAARWYGEKSLCNLDHPEYFAMGDPFTSSEIDKYSRYFHL